MNKNSPINTKPEYASRAIDLRSALEAFAEGERRAMSVCFPACVRSYDRKTHTAEVQPLIKEGYFTGKWEYITKEPYTVTVRAIQIGGFTVDIPLYVGDTGWVIASDRDTTLLKQDGALTKSVLEKDRPQVLLDSVYPQVPHQPILHDFSRGFFIPDNWGIWDYEKFKDNDDIEVKDALYIGTAIDTEDEYKQLTPDSEDDITDVTTGLQTESKYEKKSTASIVIERDGGVHLLSSTPKEKKRTARITIKGSVIETEVKDKENKRETYSGLGVITDKGSSKTGFVVRQKDKQNEVKYEYDEGKLSIESKCDKDEVKITIEDGKLKIETSKKINIRASGKMQVNTRGDIKAEAQSAIVSTAGAASLIVNGKCQISSSKSINIHGASNVKIGAMKDLKIEASKDINISGATLTFESLKNINHEVKKFEFVAKGVPYKNVSLTTEMRDYSIKCEGSSIDVHDNTMTIETETLTMSSQEEHVHLYAGEKLRMGGCTPQLTDYTQGVAGGTSAWVY